jgi:hypothetical protein
LKKNILIFGLIAVFLECAPRIVISPEYADFKSSGKSLGIKIVGKPTIVYAGSVENEFGKGNQDSLILKYVASGLSLNMKNMSRFTVLKSELSFKDSCLKIRQIPRSLFRIMLPSSSSCPPDSESDVTLFIDSLSISSVPTANIVSVGLIPVMVVPYKPLYLNYKYCYWDNVKQKAIAWGKAEACKADGVAVDIKIWDYVIWRATQNTTIDTSDVNRMIDPGTD